MDVLDGGFSSNAIEGVFFLPFFADKVLSTSSAELASLITWSRFFSWTCILSLHTPQKTFWQSTQWRVAERGGYVVALQFLHFWNVRRTVNRLMISWLVGRWSTPLTGRIVTTKHRGHSIACPWRLFSFWMQPLILERLKNKLLNGYLKNKIAEPNFKFTNDMHLYCS